MLYRVFPALLAFVMTAACSPSEEELGKRSAPARAKKTAAMADTEDDSNFKNAKDATAKTTKGKADTGKVSEDLAESTKGAGKGEGKGLPTDDDDDAPAGKGGGKLDLPTQSPVQTGKGGSGKQPDDEEPIDDEEPVEDEEPTEEDVIDPVEDPDVVVDLPVEACPYFDPAAPSFVIKKDQFAPGLPPIPVPSTHIKGALEGDQNTYIGFFQLFIHPLVGVWTLNWNGQKGWIPHDYTFVVVGAQNSECTAYLRYVKQNPRTLNGCFAQDTRIRMADGKDQIIAAITVGDMVLNPVTGKAMRVAEVLKGPEAKPMWEIGFAGRTMRVTELHPVPVKGALKWAKDVTTDDYVYDENGIIHRVTVAKALPVKPDPTVFNIRLDTDSSAERDHMVLADGVISGDLYLQRKLAETAVATAK